MRDSSVIVKMAKKMLMRVFESPRQLHYLPEDMKEGHFVVQTVDEKGDAKRFVIEMSYLAHPGFLKLLEHAAEEFGFKQEGVLAVPCRPNGLTRILESTKQSKA